MCDSGITDNLGPDVYVKWRASEPGSITESLEDRLLFAKTIFCFMDDPTEGFVEIALVRCTGGRLVISELGRWSFWASRMGYAGAT
ncbi:MAG: hypothetical protein WD767_13235 [Alphaproteobacteria bacterium]